MRAEPASGIAAITTIEDLLAILLAMYSRSVQVDANVHMSGRAAQFDYTMHIPIVLVQRKVAHAWFPKRLTLPSKDVPTRTQPLRAPHSASHRHTENFTEVHRGPTQRITKQPGGTRGNFTRFLGLQ